MHRSFLTAAVIGVVTAARDRAGATRARAAEPPQMTDEMLDRDAGGTPSVEADPVTPTPAPRATTPTLDPRTERTRQVVIAATGEPCWPRQASARSPSRPSPSGPGSPDRPSTATGPTEPTCSSRPGTRCASTPRTRRHRLGRRRPAPHRHGARPEASPPAHGAAPCRRWSARSPPTMIFGGRCSASGRSVARSSPRRSGAGIDTRRGRRRRRCRRPRRAVRRALLLPPPHVGGPAR